MAYNISEEYIIPCACGKQWQRKDIDKYYKGEVRCQHHTGAKEWYEAAIDLTNRLLEAGQNE